MEKLMVFGKGRKRITIDWANEYSSLVQITIWGILNENGEYGNPLNLWFCVPSDAKTAPEIRQTLVMLLYAAKHVVWETQGYNHVNYNRLEEVYDQVGNMRFEGDLDTDDYVLVEGGA
tara:strand:+ start:112 stop:465 length:354 start_codon:yes stop_codon:yes gene_type:complete